MRTLVAGITSPSFPIEYPVDPDFVLYTPYEVADPSGLPLLICFIAIVISAFVLVRLTYWSHRI